LVDRLNTIFNPLRFKARGNLTWDYDGIVSRVTVNHVGGYRNNTLAGGRVQNVSSYTTVDLGVTFNIGEARPKNFFAGGYSFGIDVMNALDTNPPYVNFAPTVNGSGGYDATAANPIGREIAVTVRKKF